MLKIVLSLFIVLAYVKSETRTQCTQDSQCNQPLECCYYHEGPMIVSKRAVFPAMHQGGWCERYLTDGARCNPFDKVNGHCSCGPGLTCTRFPYTTTASAKSKRKLLPGDYLCAPKA